MQIQGYKPVLAHPERYPFWHQKMDEYEKLIDLGVLMQLNLTPLVVITVKVQRKFARK